MMGRVQDVLHAHQAEIFTCVQKEKVSPSGEVLVRVFAGRGGVVASANVLKNQAGSSSTLDACLIDSITRWDIGSLGTSEGDQIVFPLAFKPERVQHVVHRDDAKSYPIANGKGAARLFLDGSTAPLALDEVTAPKDTKIPSHRHAGSEEILYVLEGRGSTTIDGETFTIAPGDVIRIPANVEHSLVVTSALRAIQIYSPSGPEQRFKGKP